MPLPSQVMERLSHEPAKTPGVMSRLIIFSLAVFVLVLLIYLGIAFGYTPYLQKKINNLNDQINTFNQQVPADEQAQLITFYSQLSNLKNVLADRGLAFPILGWLEQNTGANVYYTTLGFNSTNWELSLSGNAKTAVDFEQQLRSWENDPNVQNASVNSLTTDKTGIWKFSANVFLNKNLGQPKP